MSHSSNNKTQPQEASALLSQKEFLPLIEKVADIGYWHFSVDREGSMLEPLFWSEQMFKIHQTTAEEYTPDPVSSILFYHPDDRGFARQKVADAMQKQAPFEFKLRLLAPDKTIRYVYVKGECKVSDDRHYTTVFGVSQDITEQEETIIKLKDAIAFQELISQAIPDLIFVKDADYRIVAANPAFLNVYPEETRDKVIGTTTLEEYDEEEAKEFLKYDTIAFEEGQSETYEVIRFPDGSTRKLYTKKVRFENQSKEPFILGIARDVTEREKLIEDLMLSNQELERFAYVASHDLQEPVRMIRNFTELLQKRCEESIDEKGKQYIAITIKAAHRMQVLIDDLLKYARITEDSEQHTEIDLNQNIEYVAEILQHRINETGTSIIHETLPTIYSNAVPISRIFQNLFENAIKYQIKDNPPTIEISVEKQKKHWLICVKDNGIGIKPEYWKKIFFPFQRLHHRNEYKGTGIGLAVCRKSIERMGGTIWVESEYGQGSSFKFTVPIVRK